MHATTESFDACPLPNVNGRGLSRDEVFRINRARNKARADFGIANPDCPMSEVDRAGRDAAAAEFRRVLADRTAVALPVCCSPAEAAPCQGCLDANDMEADPSTWPAWTDERWTLGPGPDHADDVEPTQADRAWWVENCPAATSTPRTPAAALGLIPTATAERLADLSLVGRHGDIDLY
jgi:hypothetical protein